VLIAIVDFVVVVVLLVDVSVFVVVTTFVVVLGGFVEEIAGLACVLSGIFVSPRHVEHRAQAIKPHFLPQSRPSSAHHDAHLAHAKHAPQAFFHSHLVSHASGLVAHHTLQSASPAAFAKIGVDAASTITNT
jgi:hypothetical protein